MRPLILTLAFIASLTFIPATASAQSGTACHLLTSAQSIPNGFGAAYNLFSSAKEVLLSVSCGTSSATLTVGSGADTTYIYKNAYEWDGSSWKAVTLGGQNLAGDSWYIGSVSSNLNRTQAQLTENNFVVAYICQWRGSDGWKCGCRDSSCSTNYWQLQGFRQNNAATGGIATEQAKPSPLPKKLFYPGAKFPSADFAPIKEPYIFGMQTVPFPVSHDGLKKDSLEFVPPFNMNGEDNRGGTYYDNRAARFRSMGILPLFHLAPKNRSDNKETINRIYNAGRPGMMIDEFINNSSPPTCPSWCKDTIAGTKQVAMQDPAFFIWAWVTNVDRTLPSYITKDHTAFDVIAAEAYVAEDTNFWWNIFDTFVANVKKSGFEEKTLIGIVGGWDRGDKGVVIPTERMLRRQFETIRRELPRSPGVGLWANWQVNDQLLASGVFKKLINDIWYDNSPSASITSLSNGQTVSGAVDVTVRGTPNGATNEPIRYYRYFIDNTMVAESPHSTFRWNTAKYSKGAHTFTVHAVDEDYLVGVEQIAIEIE